MIVVPEISSNSPKARGGPRFQWIEKTSDCQLIEYDYTVDYVDGSIWSAIRAHGERFVDLLAEFTLTFKVNSNVHQIDLDLYDIFRILLFSLLTD